MVDGLRLFRNRSARHVWRFLECEISMARRHLGFRNYFSPFRFYDTPRPGAWDSLFYYKDRFLLDARPRVNGAVKRLRNGRWLWVCKNVSQAAETWDDKYVFRQSSTLFPASETEHED